MLTFFKDAYRLKLLPIRRSPHWPAVRHQFLRTHGTCAACGTTQNLEVHHMQPYHLRPELELIPTNFITLCEGPQRCHLIIGHLGNWHSYNPGVITDAAASLLKHQQAPHALPVLNTLGKVAVNAAP